MRKFVISAITWIANFFIALSVVEGLIFHDPMVSIVAMVVSFMLYCLVAVVSDKGMTSKEIDEVWENNEFDNFK